MTGFIPAGDDERRGLRHYLTRLLALDTRASVRLQGAGQVLGVWGGPPLDVVTLRPVALAVAVEPIDTTVSATRLLERLEAGDLPPAIPGPSWAGLLPPRAGWRLLATVPAAAVHDSVRVGVSAFQRRVELVPSDDRSRAQLDAAAAEVWLRPVVAGVPLRAAHAAELVGFLGRDGEVAAYGAGAWLRLACPGGSVALRTAGAGPIGVLAL